MPPAPVEYAQAASISIANLGDSRYSARRAAPAQHRFHERLWRERSAHITVVCVLSGQEARFLVDTGAGGTCIDSGALETYGLAVKGKLSSIMGGSFWCRTAVLRQ